MKPVLLVVALMLASGGAGAAAAWWWMAKSDERWLRDLARRHRASTERRYR